jgi:hypothetical protein
MVGAFGGAGEQATMTTRSEHAFRGRLDKNLQVIVLIKVIL